MSKNFDINTDEVIELNKRNRETIEKSFSRKQKRAIQRMARKASKKAMKELDKGITNIYNAKYNTTIHYIEDEDNEPIT